MRAKTVNEFQKFEREQDPKTALGIGRFQKNPIPTFVKKTNELMQNPREINFSDFNNLAEKTREEFIFMIFSNALEEKYKIKPEELSNYGGVLGTSIKLSDGSFIRFMASRSLSSWTGILFDSKGWKIDSIGASFSFPKMIEKIDKMLKKNKIYIGQ